MAAGRLWWWAWSSWVSSRFRRTLAGVIVTVGMASFAGGRDFQVRRRLVVCWESAGASWWSWRRGTVTPWRGFWRALLGVGCWWGVLGDGCRWRAVDVGLPLQ